MQDVIAPDTISRTERGYLNQHELHEVVSEAFQGDEFLPVKRGVSGADLEHKVFYLTNGKPVCAGTILYEAKRVRDWKPEFVAAAKRACQIHQTPHIIIVSNTLPDESEASLQDGVLVVSPKALLPVATAYRFWMVEAHRAGLQAKGMDATKILEYVTSDKFRVALDAILNAASSLKKRLEREKTQLARHWIARASEYETISGKTVEIQESILSLLRVAGRPVTH